MIAFNPALAGGPLADLGIEVEVEPAGITPPGTKLVALVTITNQGPDTGSALFTVRQTNDGIGFSFPPIAIFGLLSGPCTVDPLFDPPPEIFFVPWIIRDIPAGESRACTFSFTVLETTKKSQIARWAVFAIGGSDDPDDTNNVANVLIRFAESPDPVAVPGLNLPGLLLLALLLGWIAFYRVSRHQP